MTKLGRFFLKLFYSIPLLFLPSLLILWYWKNIILRINTSLLDTNDYPFLTWVIYNNITKFKELDLSNLYETNAMYPFRFSLSFAEHLFFPSFLAFLVDKVVNNIISTVNILILINHFLIFLSAYLLGGIFLSKRITRTIFALYLSFSPYFFTQLGHFQMLFYWPLLLSLFFLLKHDKKRTTVFSILSGVFLGIQFLSSVYLGIMGIVCVLIYFITQLITIPRHQIRIFLPKALTKFLIPIGLSILIAFPSLYGYYLAKKEYSPKRDIKEFIIYSAHITDYLFTSGNQPSIIYNHPFIQKWKKLDKHTGGERAAIPGIIPLSMIIVGIFLSTKLRKEKETIKIEFFLNKILIYAFLLTLVGFIASLGPRLNVNGVYVHIPMPYYLIIKTIPLASIIRALARWYFIFTLGIGIMYSVYIEIFLKKLSRKIHLQYILLSSLLIANILEFIPYYTPKGETIVIPNVYSYISSNLCSTTKQSLLEYPFTYRNVDGTLIKDLKYKTLILLSSTTHKCRILSGFSGYEPLAYLKIKTEFDNGLTTKDLELMRNLKIDFLKINKFAISKDEWKKISTSSALKRLEKLYEDKEAAIFKVK